MDALEVLSNIRRLDVLSVAQENVSGVTDVIADLNTSQLSYGLNISGASIGEKKPYKNFEYAQFKYELNPVAGFGNPDLRSTGAFYRGLYAAVKGEDITFGSLDEKESKLEKKYSNPPVKGSIFGLTEDSKDNLVIGHLQPAWEKRVTEITGLEFG